MIELKPGLIAVSLFAFAACIAPAHAQLARTFVSSFGSDANNCDRGTPCRTFQRAHDNTLANGEITVLDPGGYGAVSINRAISIINDGVGEAGMLVSGGLTGIAINAGPTDAVTLRGLTVKGIGFGGGDGIVFNTGLSLTIENCVIRNLTGSAPVGQGIRFLAPGTSTLAVSNSAVTDNQSGGIFVAPSGVAIVVSAVLDRVGLYNNGIFGFELDTANADNASKVIATIANSVAGNKGGIGYWSFSTIGKAISSVFVINSVAAGNGIGLRADSVEALVAAGGSALIGNETDIIATSGTAASFGNNYVANNTVTNGFNGAITLR
jgi:hypothetical protein